ncbi:unnamed protein product [Lampetra planeri]
MLPKEKNVERKGSSVSGEMLLRAKRHLLPPAPATESLCNRHINSTITRAVEEVPPRGIRPGNGGFDL